MSENFVFFGTDDVAKMALEHLQEVGLSPILVVDKKIDKDIEAQLQELACKFAVLVSYGKIVPKRVIDMFPKGILNIHPSLLPKLRGPSPIKSAIMENLEETGVSIMLLDQELDHGPILGSSKINLSPRIATEPELRVALLTEGVSLLTKLLNPWLEARLSAKEQIHTEASFTRKFTTEDAFIDPTLILGQSRPDEIAHAERKVRALNPEPGTFTTIETAKGHKRLKILKAELGEGRLVPTLVQPAGKTPMAWEAFLRGNKITVI